MCSFHGLDFPLASTTIPETLHSCSGKRLDDVACADNLCVAAESASKSARKVGMDSFILHIQ